jgi:hypothetical protein
MAAPLLAPGLLAPLFNSIQLASAARSIESASTLATLARSAPAGLLPGFIAYTVRTSETPYRQTAVGLDVRNRPEDLAEVPRLVESLRKSGIGCEMLFLRADNETLLKRFSETRRRHPLTSGPAWPGRRRLNRNDGCSRHCTMRPISPSIPRDCPCTNCAS